MIDIVLVVIVLISSPYIVYMSVKLGTYAFYRGRQLFERENKNGEGKGRTASGIGTSQGRDT